MKKFYHKKLIRDKIPEIIESNNGKYELRIMKENEFKKELRQKLIEESKEVIKANKKELEKELADVLEIIKSIAESEDICFKIIEKEQKARRKERGNFKKRLFLIWSDKEAGK
ncbi:MAG: nucleoside triphosphate pyrophosphohydrolase [Patescibacteria group bacterium]|nr:nucleoside triphosphate pyrophosphohydrolase [Patescibacteria group bacterium]